MARVEERPPTQKPTPFCHAIVQQIEASAERQREQRRNNPQPWIARKLAVFMVFGILGYTYYVYVVRFCITMVRKRSNALGGRAQGVAYLVVFNVLFLAVLWSYLKVLLTPPGTARDHTPKCAAPEPRFSSPNRADNDSMYSDSFSLRGGPAYAPSSRVHSPQSSVEAASPDPDTTLAASHDGEQHKSLDVEKGDTSNASHAPEMSGRAQTASPTESAAQAYARSYAESSLTRTASHLVATAPPMTPPPATPAHQYLADNVVELDAIPPIAALHAEAEPHNPNNLPSSAPEDRRPSRVDIKRQPPQSPVLAPEYRYCWRDEIIKPSRTHHCRICGTCTLMFDHHCPWIGQCVGARNRRFFLIFCGYNTVFCLWVAITLIASVATHTDNFDGQEVAVIVLGGLFTLFTGSLAYTHAVLIMLNLTTVEQLSMQSMKRRERAVLNAAFEMWEFREKARKRREWDAEWGRIGREGNIWWLGSTRKNWEAMMGPSPWYWFFPIGHAFNDGLSFPRNPRFDDDGRWRPRAEWPAELR